MLKFAGNIVMNTKKSTFFDKLTNSFLEENKKLNLSSFKTESEVYEKHILDSIEVLKAFPDIFNKPDLKILDLGTGGGFPGTPILLSLPNVHMTYLDSTRKKVDAIGRILGQLEVPRSRYELLWGRAEELGHLPKYHHKFDIVIARAVALLPIVIEWMSPFVKKDGNIILWKQAKTWEEEQSTFDKKGIILGSIYKYNLPSFSDDRILVNYKKVD